MRAYSYRTKKKFDELLQSELDKRTMEHSQYKEIEKPIPNPTHTKEEIIKILNVSKLEGFTYFKDKERNKILADLQKPGLYFKWSGNVVRYVGRAKHLGNRIRNNYNKLENTDLISYITYDDQKYYMDELYYIWRCYPYNDLNREVARSLEKLHA